MRKYYEHTEKKNRLEELNITPTCGACIKQHDSPPCFNGTKCVYK